MEIEEELDAFLKANSEVAGIAGNRGYPLNIPLGADLPAWAYQRIASRDPELIHNGVSGREWARVQITAQAETYAQAKALMRAIQRATGGYRGLMGSIKIEECRLSDVTDSFIAGSPVFTARRDILIEFKGSTK